MRVSWKELNEQVMGCEKCGLHQMCKRYVFGEGAPDADLMLIGEGPGAEEDRTGRPFVGPAGRLLTKMLAAIDIERDQAYICNVVKCRPPGNRDPEPQEVDACIGYLRAQVALVRPRVIVSLGRTASRAILKESIVMGRDHGRWFERKGIWMLPTFHPSALLRDESLKRPAWKDFQAVRAKLDKLQEEVKRC